MKRLAFVTAGLLAACTPTDAEVVPREFAAFPNAQTSSFACMFVLDGAALDEVVFGTDASDPEQQAFVYYGEETLRLLANAPVVFGEEPVSATYRVYDYPDFRVLLNAVPGGEGWAGGMQMQRRTGDEFVALGEAVAVNGICKA